MPHACIHTHTVFCDGHDDIETFCLAAKAKGLAAIGFSAHAPLTAKTGIQSEWNLPDEKLPEYIEAVKAAKKRWEGILPVYLGLEVDYISGLMGPADKDYLEMGLDYIIGSSHYILPPSGVPFTVDASPEVVEQGIKESYGGDPLALVEAYWDSLEGLIRGKGFDILGHPDLIKRNNAQCHFFSEESQLYKKRIAGAAALAGEQGVTIEVNTGGMNRGRTDTPYPSLPFLRLFRENNVPAVISADAHNPEDLDGYYPEAREILLAAGYKKTVLFKGKKDGCPVWQEEELQ